MRLSAAERDDLLDDYPGAQFIVRVEATQVFPNCPRYTHHMALIERSRFVPRVDHETPIPDWKRSAWACDVLPENDDGRGLRELVELLERRFAEDDLRLEDEIQELEHAFARQPLVHLYGFALRREAGEEAAARGSLDALMEVDPGDPMAAHFDASLRSEAVVSASEQARMANIAKFATTPLLKNPYSLALDAMFEAIREREQARVLDVGIGGCAQMQALLAVLGQRRSGADANARDRRAPGRPQRA